MTKQEREEKKLMRMQELLQIEDELRESGVKNIAGIDEVGRGPLAGPVYAACVILPSDFRVAGVDDSKKCLKSRERYLARKSAKRLQHMGWVLQLQRK